MDSEFKKQNFEIADPQADSLIQSMRAVGYALPTAIADIIDNSITANAKNIQIQFEWNQGHPWIAIIDDGYGMTEDELSSAMRFGSSNPLLRRETNDLGRFGLGLKTASLSQAKRLTVISKKNNKISQRCWDIDFVAYQHTWALLKEISETATDITTQFLSEKSHGTVVLWEKLDMLIPEENINDKEYQKKFLEHITDVKTHIAMVFSSFTGRNKIKFYINDRLIDMWDPFLTNNTHVQPLPQEIKTIKGQEVEITPYVLPYKDNLTEEEFKKASLDSSWYDLQGFYVYRNNRMIVAGDWLLPKLKKVDKYMLARIRIDINNEQDKLWSIDVRKSIAIPPVEIVRTLERIAKKTRSESEKVYRHRGKSIGRRQPNDCSFVWRQIKKGDKISYVINREHYYIKQLMNSELKKEIVYFIKMIEETIPLPSIISDYSENPNAIVNAFDMATESDSKIVFEKMKDYYRVLIANGLSEQSTIDMISVVEPFKYFPELIGILMSEEKVLKHE